MPADSETEPPDDKITHRSLTASRREGRLRCGWTGSPTSVFRQRYRLSVRVDDRRKAAVTATVGWILALRGCEASCQVSNYQVSAGQTGYIISPGTAGPESVSAVSRSGTDVAARFRMRLGSLRLGLYWDRRWGKPARWYLSAGVRM